ncbi:MAG: PolC-type DNA polymerase III [Clostridia bacterium]|nr:PolC-type DNA polymerase III [Clostridia bacterium]
MDQQQNERTTFLKKFQKYNPSPARRDLLASSEWIGMRYKRDPLRVEVDLHFDERVDVGLLHSIERELSELYDAASFRIFPHMPPECFRADLCMHEVADEATRIGAVTPGFFYDASYSDDGETVVCELPFLAPGVDLVNDAKTSDLLERILASRYGVTRRVVIRSCEDAAERTAERLARYDAENRAMQEELFAENLARAEEERKAREEEERKKNLAKKTSLTGGEKAFVTRENGSRFRVGTTVFETEGAEWIFGLPVRIDAPTPMATVNDARSDLFVCGTVFSNANRANRTGDRITYTVGFSDGTSSLLIKKTVSPDEKGWLDSLTPGTVIAVSGRMLRDRMNEEELTLSPKAVAKIGAILRSDDAAEKRVELHLHTNMSAMDALIRPDELVATAERWGHKAVAVTDHGNVQSFPELMLAKEKQKASVKILYGIECYFVNDTERAVYGTASPSLSDEMVVFDIETTGLDNRSCGITEIGAVLVRGGEIIDRFDTFVDPGMPIPPAISELTGITDEMVKGAPTPEEALKRFLEFAGDRVLIAHNANFDVGFLRVVSQNANVPFPNTYLDTVALSRYVNPELKKHKLDVIAEHYKLGDFNHHRAVDDAEMLARIFFVMCDRLREEGIRNFEEMNAAMSERADPLRLPTYHMVVFAKNRAGLKNLYKLITASYLDYYKRYPRMPKSLIERHREGLMIGSACESGEVYRAVLNGVTGEPLDEIASFYDYFEIQPLSNNRFLIAEGKVKDDEALMELNRKIVELAKKQGKPCVATCDAHFLNPEDEIFRKILLKGMKFQDGDRDTRLYYRTTSEMLSEFSYLGEDLAREVVITNPNAIADQIEEIRPIPEGTYPPSIPGSEEELQRLCWERAKDWYGDPVPKIVSARLAKELSSIIEHGFAVLYMIAKKLVSYSESLGYLVGSRGSVGSSLVASMAGISEVNPLPPHYRCPKCRHTEFFTDGSVGSGFDLPDKNCPECGTLLISDGHDIPFETFLGFHGDKSPDIDLNFSGDVQGKVHKFTEQLFGEGNVYRAGTIGTLASKTAFGYVMKYLEEKQITLPRAEVERLVTGCCGIKRTTGQHPGGIIVVPKEYDVSDFTPIQHPADDPNSDIKTTHFQFSYLHDTILKLDELGHDIPTKYKMLERYTNTSVLDVKMNDPAVYQLFESTKPLGITAEENGGCQLGTYGLPEMGTHFIQGVLMDAKPKNFADLLQISGLTHGTDVWLGNAQDLIKAGVCDISKVIGTRDGIMLDLIRYGLPNADAFKIMEAVRKGKGLKPEWETEMREHGVPDWYIGSCKKIKYMFPKAHAAAYVMSAIRLGWYKIHYPMEFYAAFLSVAPGGFDAAVVMKGKSAVFGTISELSKKQDATQKEQETVTTLQLVGECLARGIRFLPPDLKTSDAACFLPENGMIRMPFNALSGVGDTAAQKIVEARNAGEIWSVEDLRQRAGLSRAVIDVLRSAGVLDNLTETNQISFF